MTGGQGWCWRSCTKVYKHVPQDTVGLRAVAKKLQARKRKNEKGSDIDSSGIKQESDVKTEIKQEMVEGMEVAAEMEVKSEDVASEVKSEAMASEIEVKTETMDNASDDCVEGGNLDSGNDGGLCNKSYEEKMDDDEVKKESFDIDSPTKKIDVESGSPVKKNELDVIVVAPRKHRFGTSKMEIKIVEESEDKKIISVNNALHTVTINKAASKSLPPILDIETLDISKAMNERTYYEKITKPYAKLDVLLQKRVKQDEIETKQRQALQQQINWKLKVQANPGIKEESVEKGDSDKSTTSTTDPEMSLHHDDNSIYTCYSYLCQSEGKSMCYSPVCIHSRSLDEELTTGLEDTTSKTGDEEEDEDVDIEGDKDEKKEENEKEGVHDTSEEKMEVDVEGADENKSEVKMEVEVGEERVGKVTSSSEVKTETGAPQASVVKPEDSKTVVKTEDNKPKTSSSTSAPSLLQNKKNPFFTTAQLALKQAIEKMSVDELKNKMPPTRSTKEKIKLVKYSRFGQKMNKKKATLPPCHKYLTPCGKRTLFALEKYDLKRMARKCGRIETKAFNYNCKMNHVNWIYPCPRPLFKTAWRFRTQTVRTFGAVALQLRIMYACLRWDDLSVKPPVGGTNTVSTETEITTKELLKRRDVGPHMLRSEFLVRKIVVPLGITSQPKGMYWYLINIRDCYM